MQKTLEQRFWEKVDQSDDCWEWTACKRPDGYGLFYWAHGHHMWPAHRAAWTIHNGDIPRGAVVMHTCDNPGCVRPAHLRLGTQIENIKDRDIKRRHWAHTGSYKPSRKVSFTDVLAGRAEGLSYMALARKYGISKAYVADICTGRSKI